MANGENHKRRAGVRRDAARAENRERLRRYPESHPCVDCGERDPVVLEFDHVRGSKRDIVSRMLYTGCTWSAIDAEIGKCEVRCANCHRRVTDKRRRQVAPVAQMDRAPTF
jgi:transcription elongation factor Elf1